MEKISIERRFVVGFVAALAVLLLSGAQMYSSLQEYGETLRSVEHTHQVIRKLNALTSALRETESLQRAYIITHDESFLAEYKHNKGVTHTLLVQIGQSVADNPGQQVRSTALLQVVEQRLQLLDKTIEVYQSRGFADARDLIKTDVSRLKMEMVLQQTNAMEEVERTLLQQRSDHAEQNASQAIKIGALLVVAAMAGLLLLWWMVRRESLKRRLSMNNKQPNGCETR